VPQVAGTLAAAGLTAPVRIVRDTWGVPHIYAANQDDLFFAQGFVQAQDRLFQMDLWRRSALGRLSEVLGPNFIERDAMTRRIQYRGDPAAEWASYGADARPIADAFVRGINAWVAAARERPPEEFVLAGWKPEAWAADDLLNRTDAFTGSGDALDEVFRARLIATVGLGRARALLPEDRALDPASGVDLALVPGLVAEMLRRVGTPPFFLGLAAPVTAGTVRPNPDTAGGVRTLRHPSLRYFVHLNAPGWNVIGATAPWHPGVAEGHNDRLAWTAEPIDADTQDVYVERLNPTNPRQVDDAGRWVDIDVRQGVIAVRGRKAPVDFTIETTRHGVIVASDLEHHVAFAVRWAGTEPGTAAEMWAAAIDRAGSAADFGAALAHWKMPARKVTLVASDGRRTTLGAGIVPVRRGWNGALPAPAWTGAAEWSGWTTANPAPPRDGAPQTRASQVMLDAIRQHPDRGNALLQRLAAPGASAEHVAAQRAIWVDMLAQALHDREVAGRDVVFAHPLAVTPPAQQRFNVPARARAGNSVDASAIAVDAADWDRSTAINAPGQSGWADSPNFADLAALWSDGKWFPLAFSEGAVQQHTATTLTLTPR
jgi:penicillin amidase